MLLMSPWKGILIVCWVDGYDAQLHVGIVVVTWSRRTLWVLLVVSRAGLSGPFLQEMLLVVTVVFFVKICAVVQCTMHTCASCLVADYETAAISPVPQVTLLAVSLPVEFLPVPSLVAFARWSASYCQWLHSCCVWAALRRLRCMCVSGTCIPSFTVNWSIQPFGRRLSSIIQNTL